MADSIDGYDTLLPGPYYQVKIQANKLPVLLNLIKTRKIRIVTILSKLATKKNFSDNNPVNFGLVFSF